MIAALSWDAAAGMLLDGSGESMKVPLMRRVAFVSQLAKLAGRSGAEFRRWERSVSFSDADGDQIVFALSDGVLLELVNGKIEIDDVRRLHYDTEELVLTDDSGARMQIPPARGAELRTALRELARRSASVDWQEQPQPPTYAFARARLRALSRPPPASPPHPPLPSIRREMRRLRAGRNARCCQQPSACVPVAHTRSLAPHPPRCINRRRVLSDAPADADEAIVKSEPKKTTKKTKLRLKHQRKAAKAAKIKKEAAAGAKIKKEAAAREKAAGGARVLSDYERAREANIARNKAMLMELQLDSAVAAVRTKRPADASSARAARARAAAGKRRRLAKKPVGPVAVCVWGCEGSGGARGRARHVGSRLVLWPPRARSCLRPGVVDLLERGGPVLGAWRSSGADWRSRVGAPLCPGWRRWCSDVRCGSRRWTATARSCRRTSRTQPARRCLAHAGSPTRKATSRCRPRVPTSSRPVACSASPVAPLRPRPSCRAPSLLVPPAAPLMPPACPPRSSP